MRVLKPVNFIYFRLKIPKNIIENLAQDNQI